MAVTLNILLIEAIAMFLLIQKNYQALFDEKKIKDSQ
jgi:hypothetical protein